MALAPGDRVGPYEILAPLGKGGMGAVYRARDTRLRREVALKIILDAAARDADSLARFERETRAVAALDHPNIVSIHDTGIHEGTPYAVTELLEGETLAERLSAGALDLKRSVEIAGQVADGLAAAHAKGIVHRDVKPQNIFLTSDGRAKILDFGIAHVGRPDGDLRESFATTASAVVGEVAGTVGYMSPEQVRGKTVDGRTDIFALGAVLFEMLTGHRAFGRDTPIDTLGAILTDRPETHREAEKIPADLRRLAVRCLEKEPSDRYQSARDLWLDLRAWREEGPRSLQGAEETRTRRRAPVIAAALGGALLLALGLFLGMHRVGVPNTISGPVTRVALTLSPPLTTATAERPLFAISPDGARLVYVADVGGRTRLVLREMDSLEGRALPGTEDASDPFFSPDGQWIGFAGAAELQKLALAGGAPVSLHRIPPVTRGATWGADDTIVYSPVNTGGLNRLSAATGEQKTLVRPDYDRGEQAYRWPEILPGGRALLFTIYSGGDNFDAASIAAVRLDTGEKKILVRGGTSPRYCPTGQLVYARGGTLLAAPFDIERLEVTGPAVVVLSGVQTEGTGAAQYVFSQSGVLLYLTGASPSRPGLHVVRVDRAGNARRLTAEPGAYYGARFSPDGRHVAFSKGDANQDIWILDLERGTETRLTPEASEEFEPVWSPDGKRIAYSSERQGVDPQIFLRAADGSGEEKLFWKGKDAAISQSWSPDAKFLAFTELGPAKDWDIWTLDSEKATAKAFLATPYDEAQPDFSPSGSWIAYVSNESGRYEIYARPFPGPGRKVQVSTEGGTEPAWSRGGKEMFYRNRDRLMAVPVVMGSELSIGKPAVLFQKAGFFTPPFMEFRQYDVAPDAKSFVMIQIPDAQAAAQPPVLVTNWFSEIVRRTTDRR